MKKSTLISISSSALLIMAISLLICGCGNQAPATGDNNSGLYDNNLNQEIEELTDTNTGVPAGSEPFVEFDFKYNERPEAKYEMARDDVFSMSNGNLLSTEISFMGIMLGDPTDLVISELGIPDVKFESSSRGFANLEYQKKIGIPGTNSGLTFHIENDVVTGIIVKPPFQKYLRGNTTIGLPKSDIYAIFDIPDYQDFTSSFRVFHYVEKGMSIYLVRDKVDRIEFIYPAEFKGVEYVRVEMIGEDGVLANTTKAVLVE